MSRYTAETTIREGFSTMILMDSGSNSIAEVIPEMGNNLFRFECRGNQIIMAPPSLHEFNPTYYGTPILFPPNRVKNGLISYRGREYKLPLNEPDNHLHGEISSKRWDVLEYGASDEQGAYVTSRFQYADHLEMLAYFPHELSFTVTYRLYEGQLHMSMSIVNGSEEEAPFAFGLHPYFYVPYESGEEIVLKLPASEEWPVTNRAFVEERPSITAFSESLNKGTSIKDYPELGCSLLTISDGDRICSIELEAAGYTIAYQLDKQFPYVVLFRPDWASSFSIEPYTYVTDAFNLPYEHELTGAKGIRAGEEIKLTTCLWIEAFK